MAVDDAHCFVGFDAYEKLIHSGVDVVLIAGTSHFHPVFLKAAIDAGKHVFCEKPAAIDVPGVKMAMAAAEEAKKKNLCLVSGLCWRYDPGVREAIKRVHDGAIGEIIAIQETYIRGPYVLRERQPGWNEMQYQFQNWYHFNWLSGDDRPAIVDPQHRHGVLGAGRRAAATAWGMGGRQVCVEPKYGDVFDHQAVVYEYANGVRVFGYCRDIPGCYNDNTNVILGTKGRAFMPGNPRIEGEKPGAIKGPKPSMYDVEHKELFEAIRAGKPINNGDYMCVSTMLGDPRPDGLLHGPADHLGSGHEVGVELCAAALRLGRRAARQARPQRPVSHGHARHHAVPLATLVCGLLSVGRSMPLHGPATAVGGRFPMRHCVL